MWPIPWPKRCVGKSILLCVCVFLLQAAAIYSYCIPGEMGREMKSRENFFVSWTLFFTHLNHLLALSLLCLYPITVAFKNRAVQQHWIRRKHPCRGHTRSICRVSNINGLDWRSVRSLSGPTEWTQHLSLDWKRHAVGLECDWEFWLYIYYRNSRTLAKASLHLVESPAHQAHNRQCRILYARSLWSNRQ